MFQKPTALILGADSSAHLRYPGGKELVNNMSSKRVPGLDISEVGEWTKNDVED